MTKHEQALEIIEGNKLIRKKMPTSFDDSMDVMCDAYLELWEKAQKLVEALEFYADLKSWGNEDDSNFKFMIIDDYEDKRPNKKHELYGGKKAREALAQFETVYVIRRNRR